MHQMSARPEGVQCVCVIGYAVSALFTNFRHSITCVHMACVNSGLSQLWTTYNGSVIVTVVRTLGKN